MPIDTRALSRALLEAAPDPIVVVGAHGEIVLVNGQAEKAFGYSKSEMLGAGVELLIPAAASEEHRDSLKSFSEVSEVQTMGAGLELVARRKDGSEYPVEVTLSPVQTKAGTFVIGIVRDVSAHKELEEHLRYLGTHDRLTGLYNRQFFDEEMTRLARGRHGPVGVIVVDIDGLKAANDASGHAAGDELLKRTARVLLASFRSDDVIARLGGDEFGVLLPGTGEKGLADSMRRLRQVLERHNERHEDEPLSFSVGGATARNGAALYHSLELADGRMYEDKRTRRSARRA